MNTVAQIRSVDALQNFLAGTVFARTNAPKKAAGRALGTIVELITFYMLRDWDLEPGLAIERGLPEYGNPAIRHNVEFSLHPARKLVSGTIAQDGKTVTPTVIRKAVLTDEHLASASLAKSRWLLKGGVVRHACTIAEGDGEFLTAHMLNGQDYLITALAEAPYAMFECKRVGVEEGMKKGPQTIEKAKQGAYVARTVSGLQRIPRRDGSVAAVVEAADGTLETHDDYYAFLRRAIDRGDRKALENVVLTVGVVSNHGNWFTAKDHNKEMRVLAQSYDWLLFLTDPALTEFIEQVLQGESPQFSATRRAFASSHSGSRAATTFTKVTIDAAADAELSRYFAREKPWGRWFNVITPTATPIESLQHDLHTLARIHEVNP